MQYLSYFWFTEVFKQLFTHSNAHFKTEKLIYVSWTLFWESLMIKHLPTNLSILTIEQYVICCICEPKNSLFTTKLEKSTGPRNK